MDRAAPRSLVKDLYMITADTDVAVLVTDGRWIRGSPSRIDRDEAGIRVEICPYDGDAPQYRVRVDRTPTGWQEPYIERRYVDSEWERYGSLVEVEELDGSFNY